MPVVVIEMLTQIFNVAIVPLLTVLVTYLVKWIKAKANALSAETDNEITKKYIAMLSDTVTNAVISVNQTYVDALKDKDAFTTEAQKEALAKAHTAVLNNLTEEAKKYLSEIYGDLESYIEILIEAKVRENK